MGIKKRLVLILACLSSLNLTVSGAGKGGMKQVAGNVSKVVSHGKRNFSWSKNHKVSTRGLSPSSRTSGVRKLSQSADSKVQIQKSLENSSGSQNTKGSGISIGKVVIIAGIPMILLPTGSGFGFYFLGKNLGEKSGELIGKAASKEQIRDEVLQSVKTIFSDCGSDFGTFLLLIKLITLADWKYAILENGILRLDFEPPEGAPFLPIHGAQFIAEGNKISFDSSTWNNLKFSMDIEGNIGNDFENVNEETIKKIIPCAMAKVVDKKLNMKLSDSTIKILETMFRAKIQPGLVII